MPDFKVLGALEILDEGEICTPSPPKVRQVLALLVLAGNRIVHMDSLIAELWGDEPPKSAVTTVQTYIYHLRKLFAGKNLSPSGTNLLDTRSPGYSLQTADHQVDARVFERLVAEGQVLLEAGRHQHASQVLTRALDLWTGPALANVQPGSVLQPYVVHLEEQRISALELRIQADMELGRHRHLVGELRSLVAAFPLNEWFHAQLITSLSRAGRRSEALQAYQNVRIVLKEELGISPSPDLQRIQQHVLSVGEPRLARAGAA
jgi:SARP family transcriptional regulator, regulator of embCAB operon